MRKPQNPRSAGGRMQPFRHVVESAPTGIVAVDADGLIVLVNAHAEELFGYRRDELIGEPIEVLLPERFRDGHVPYRTGFTANPEARAMGGDRDLSALRKDGSEFPVEIGLNSVPTEEGTLAIAAIVDVSERRSGTDELHRQKRILNSILTSIAEGVVVADEHGEFVHWNPAAQRIMELGPIAVPPEEWSRVYGICLPDMITPCPADELPLVRALRGEATDREELFIRRREKLEGMWISTTARPLIGEAGDVRGGVVVFHDITEEKRAQTELKKFTHSLEHEVAEGARELADSRSRQSEFGRILESSLNEIYICDAETLQFLHVNRGGRENLGYSMDELAKLTPLDLKPEFTPDTFARLVEPLRSGERPLVQLTTYHRRKDGSEYPVEVHLRLTSFESKPAFVTIILDTTLREKAEEELRRSEAEYRELFEHATYGIYRSTPEGKFLAVNTALADMLGYESKDELLRIDMERDLYARPGDRVRFMDEFGKADNIGGVEVDWKHKDDKTINVKLNGRVVRGERGDIECFEMIAEDVTEHHKLEARLRQAQKMEAVGQLTGGIAHDFNNLLTVIMVNLELAATALPREPAELWARFEDAQSAAQRGTTLVKKLLGFSRRERLKRQPVDLASLVGELSTMLRRVVPESIDISFQAQESAGGVLADPGAVEQIVLNLVTNARDAMPDGGELTIEVKRGRLVATDIAMHPWARPGGYVSISVTDTGVGMDEATKERVFEPFFTTKAVGTGTGLGMAMVYGLVKQHNGFVHIYSEVGRGTRVSVYFPATDDEAEETTRERAQDKVHGGTETILVVEDEVAIRSATRQVLERQGYRVLVAADGEEGLQVFRTHEAEIELVICDLVMPKLGGRQLCETLKSEGKRVRVLFTSGYGARNAQVSAELPPEMPFLDKPWTIAELLAQVRQVLDQ